MSVNIRFPSGSTKQNNLKRSVLGYFAVNGNTTIPDLSRELDISVPKITALVNELIQDELLKDYGKIESSGGRKPSLYGLIADSAFFIGVEVKHDQINIGATNLKNELIKVSEKLPYDLNNTPDSLAILYDYISFFIKELGVGKEKVLGIGINLSGRINYQTGHSYSYFHFEEKPLSEIIESKIGIPVFLENDSRAMAYGEFYEGVVNEEKDVLFLNLDYGIAVGILVDGSIYYGKSGYAGEFGHMPLFDNELLCHCGKKGCLETEASGWALTRMFREKLHEGSSSVVSLQHIDPENVHMEDIIRAVHKDDVLAIELIAKIGERIGRGIALLINIFNPELVILGGRLAGTGDYLRYPVQTAINKYSLSLVNNDTKLVLSKLGDRAGIVGACILVRNKMMALH
ncbi:N-acetylglucosamine repressor [Dyadobacter sp. CECT 9275]|uniref:N-acetylglucosamine repressor n=1 Tax=Dyadobacter helix TaxID=2822344 RepID=A0A916N4Y5_9BACT|nr:ROK family transcriptional regulator [Dyadobacter sp. CECT 9275]CAG4994155.1 N-acetylglucosamine repressor [Dyadobacter sp. CECT 9275]